MDREAVVEEVKTWLRTPYHPMAKVKGGGVDCGMLLAAVYHDVGLIPEIDVGYYSPEEHMHSLDETYLAWIEKFAKKVDRDPLPGDIVVYKFGKRVSHGAIVIDWPLVIHARVDVGVVYEDASQRTWAICQKAVFSVWGD